MRYLLSSLAIILLISCTNFSEKAKSLSSIDIRLGAPTELYIETENPAYWTSYMSRLIMEDMLNNPYNPYGYRFKGFNYKENKNGDVFKEIDFIGGTYVIDKEIFYEVRRTSSFKSFNVREEFRFPFWDVDYILEMGIENNCFERWEDETDFDECFIEFPDLDKEFNESFFSRMSPYRDSLELVKLKRMINDGLDIYIDLKE